MVAVFPSSFEMPRQRRPSGPAWTVDETWKDDVRAAMRSKGISRADLARQIGVSPSAITVLFRPETKQTRLKPLIHRALGFVAPESSPAVARDALYIRMMSVWPHLSDAEREHLITTGELLRAKKR
jgi:lambda repressor-like predicted transcriptional regulator